MTTIPRRKTQFHICKCGYPTYNLTSWTKQNLGRRFQACHFLEQDTDSRGCDYLKWVDIEMTEWQNNMTNSLMAYVNVQKIVLRMLKKELVDMKAEKACLELENEALKDQVTVMKKHGLMLPTFCCLLVFMVVVILFSGWSITDYDQAEKKKLLDGFYLQPPVIEDNNKVRQ
uniref:GRF-type domain-containing protein n=1 Tax=Chenopodium quinoa TaxID=63459 RepID=A0A803MWV1_CHEQI